MKRLFVFNPDCELAIANGSKFFMPSSNIVRMMEDLAFLPAWLGEDGDCVLVREFPSEVFSKEVIDIFQLKCQPIGEGQLEELEGFRGEPWGWSPKMCHWFAGRGMGQEWRTEQKEWYSRRTARRGLEILLDRLPFLKNDILPRICFSLDEIDEWIRDGKYIAKAPWSSSGKGLLALEQQLGSKEREWLGGILKRQKYLMLERRLNKLQDFAMEFRVDKQKVEFVGWSFFTTGTNGEYRGNYIGPQENIEKKLEEQLGKQKLSALKTEIPLMLEEILPDYIGWLGVDMMLYLDENGKIALQPCVEINLRYNMGIVALELNRKYVDSGREGEFSIRYFSGNGEALAEHRHSRQAFPLVYKNNRIKSGYLNLTPVSEATHFVASVRCY